MTILTVRFEGYISDNIALLLFVRMVSTLGTVMNSFQTERSTVLYISRTFMSTLTIEGLNRLNSRNPGSPATCLTFLHVSSMNFSVFIFLTRRKKYSSFWKLRAGRRTSSILLSISH